MPSLPTLPAKNASLRDSAAISALYNKATREYVNRNFAAALSTISVLRAQHSSPKSKRKAFSLYLAVLDAISSLEPEQLKHDFGREGHAIADKLKTGATWEEAESYFGADLPNEVAINLILTSTTHAKDLRKLQDRVESLLTSLEPDTSAHDSISELYALHVLPRCGEWDIARGFIEGSDMPQATKSQWSDALVRIAAEQEENKKRLVREAEEARKSEMEAKKLRKVRKSRSGGSKKSATSVSGSNRGTVVLAGSKKVEATGNQQPVGPVTQVEQAAPVTSPDRVLTPVSSIRRWGQGLTARFSPRIVKVLLLLAVIFGATGRRAFRERIQAVLRKVGSTIVAGVKVSYL